MISYSALTFLVVAGLTPWLRHPTVQVKDCGIYDADVTAYGDWGVHGPVGVFVDRGSMKLAQSITKVPCKPGITFGVRVDLTNPYTDGDIEFHFKFSHPAFTTPDGKVHTVEDDEVYTVAPGQTVPQSYLWCFIKECPYEFVPGKWTLTISVNGQDLATKEFEVYQPEGGPPKD